MLYLKDLLLVFAIIQGTFLFTYWYFHQKLVKVVYIICQFLLSMYNYEVFYVLCEMRMGIQKDVSL